MTTSTVTITDFLLARIAHDEGVARGALGLSWSASGYRQIRTRTADIPSYYEIAGEPGAREHWDHQARVDPGTSFDHIARHDPARVLAECAAKRVIVKRFLTSYDIVIYPVVAALAAVYADHPDYRSEWAS